MYPDSDANRENLYYRLTVATAYWKYLWKIIILVVVALALFLIYPATYINGAGDEVVIIIIRQTWLTPSSGL